MTETSKLILATLLATTLAASVSPAFGAAPDKRRVDAAFSGLAKDGPGCALGIYERGKPVLLQGYGFANLEHRIPITPDTVFNIGSVSKQFTATSIAILAEQGLLAMDDDIRKYLPEMPDYGTPVTIRQLVNHTSGIRNYFDVLFLKGLSQSDPVTQDEAYRLITQLPKLQFTPGSQYRYSNSGYLLMARIVERVSGQSLAKFQAQNIFAPLGMTSTFVHDDPAAVVPHRAYGYLQDPKGGFRAVSNMIETTGDGAVFTTVRDLARWDADFYNGTVWRPAVKAEMLRVNLLTDGQQVASEPGVYYAGGLNLGKRRGLSYVSHQGKDRGFMAELTRYPDQQVTVALLCNQILRIGDIADGVTDLLLAGRYTQAADTTPQRSREPASPGVPVPPDVARAVSGTYHSAGIDSTYVLAEEGGELALRIGPHQLRVGPLRQFEDGSIGVARFRLKLQRTAQDVTGFSIEGFEFVRAKS